MKQKYLIRILIIALIFLIGNRHIIVLKICNIEYTTCNIIDVHCTDGRYCIHISYEIDNEVYEKLVFFDRIDIENKEIRKGEVIKCIFYSHSFPSISRFDFDLYTNPDKEYEITQNRVDKKNFRKSARCRSTDPAMP